MFKGGGDTILKAHHNLVSKITTSLGGLAEFAKDVDRPHIQVIYIQAAPITSAAGILYPILTCVPSLCCLFSYSCNAPQLSSTFI